MSDWPPERNRDPSSGAPESPVAAVSHLATSGLPLESGLMALSDEAPSWRLRRLLRKMSRDLAHGHSPEEVLAGPQRGLPHFLRGLVRAGVGTGRLGEFLEHFLLSLRRRREAALSTWAALAYPLLLLPFALLVGFGILGWIIPQFKEIFNDFGVDLPASTRSVLILGSRPVLIGVFTVVPTVVLLFVLICVFGRFLPGHAGRLRAFQQIPVIGTASRMRGQAEFCSLLGLLISGRVALPDALRMTAAAIHDANLRQGAKQLATRSEQGESLEAAAGGLPQISRELGNLFRWEPRGDAFGDMLLRAGEAYSSRSRAQSGVVMVLLQPFLFLGVAGVIGFVVTSLFLPLIKLLNELA